MKNMTELSSSFFLHQLVLRCHHSFDREFVVMTHETLPFFIMISIHHMRSTGLHCSHCLSSVEEVREDKRYSFVVSVVSV
jgi:hypothetical protein